MAKRIKAKPGDFVAIPLGEGYFGFARILLQPPTAGFYDFRSRDVQAWTTLDDRPFLFVVSVMDSMVKRGDWQILGNRPLTPDQAQERWYFKKDLISGQLTVYLDSTQEERPATKSECEGLECAAVWSNVHIVSRLNDHFAGMPNKFVESLKAKLG